MRMHEQHLSIYLIANCSPSDIACKYTLMNRAISVMNRAISKGGGLPKGDRKPGFLFKMFLTSFVGTDIVFDNDRFPCA